MYKEEFSGDICSVTKFRTVTVFPKPNFVLKGVCHAMNIFLKAVLYMLFVFTIFRFLVVEKNQTQKFSLLLWNYLLILKICPVTCFKDPKAAILTLKMLAGSRMWVCKIIPEAACDKLIVAHFPCSQWEVGTREHRPITEKGSLRRVSVSILKISK